MQVKVENETLVRDMHTGAILETDVSKLNRHRAIKSSKQRKEQTIDILLEKINKLEETIERIKYGINNT